MSQATGAVLPVERMSRRRRAGIVLLVLALGGLVLGLGSAWARMGGAVDATILGRARALPVDTTMTLEAGPWVVLEGSRTTDGDPGRLTPDRVAVVAADGRALRPRVPGTTQTVTRDGEVYTGAVAFEVPATGRYRVNVEGEGRSVIIGPDLMSSFLAAVGWMLLAGFSFVGGLVLVVLGRRRRPATVGAVASVGGVAAPGGPPAGWYPDPERPGQVLWWDGSRWHGPRGD